MSAEQLTYGIILSIVLAILALLMKEKDGEYDTRRDQSQRSFGMGLWNQCRKRRNVRFTYVDPNVRVDERRAEPEKKIICPFCAIFISGDKHSKEIGHSLCRDCEKRLFEREPKS